MYIQRSRLIFIHVHHVNRKQVVSTILNKLGENSSLCRRPSLKPGPDRTRPEIRQMNRMGRYKTRNGTERNGTGSNLALINYFKLSALSADLRHYVAAIALY